MEALKYSVFQFFNFSTFQFSSGGLAQLARAPALQAGGQRFESVILHKGENRMDAVNPISDTLMMDAVNPEPDTEVEGWFSTGVL